MSFFILRKKIGGMVLTNQFQTPNCVRKNIIIKRVLSIEEYLCLTMKFHYINNGIIVVIKGMIE